MRSYSETFRREFIVLIYARRGRFGGGGVRLAGIESRRRHTRHAVSVEATLLVEGDPYPLRCGIIDISPGGAGLSYDPLRGALPPGQVGRLAAVGADDIAVEVRWSAFGKLGVAFGEHDEARRRFFAAVSGGKAAD